MMHARSFDIHAPHVPVLLDAVLRLVAPVAGVWIDGTFGAGGYARALIAAGAEKVIGIDRDPHAGALAGAWLADFPAISLVSGNFADMDTIAPAPVDGVVLDLGVSSMQLDDGARGFSFRHDGPLDMRMGDTGPNAADIVNTAPEEHIADILHHFGEERAARRIARAITRAREKAPITTTGELAAIIERAVPHARARPRHPATKSFQALRIAVNHELEALARGLFAAERILKPGGKLAVVTFHSLEDRIVKRFFQHMEGRTPGGSRHAPARTPPPARFQPLGRGSITPDESEIAANPRARSARLRAAVRTTTPPLAGDEPGLILPPFVAKGRV